MSFIIFIVTIRPLTLLFARRFDFYLLWNKAKFVGYYSKGDNTLDRVLIASPRLFSGFLLIKDRKDSVLNHFQIMQQDTFIFRRVSNGTLSVWLKAYLWSQHLACHCPVLKVGLHLTLGSQNSLFTDNSNKCISLNVVTCHELPSYLHLPLKTEQNVERILSM